MKLLNINALHQYAKENKVQLVCLHIPGVKSSINIRIQTEFGSKAELDPVYKKVIDAVGSENIQDELQFKPYAFMLILRGDISITGLSERDMILSKRESDAYYNSGK